MVFLKPTILRDANAQAKLTSEKYNYIRAQQLWTKDRGVKLMSNDSVPILPERFVDLPAPFEQEMEPSTD